MAVSKEDIKTAAHELCESYARRTTHDAFIKAYNALEAKLIAAVGVGKIHSYPPPPPPPPSSTST